VKTFGDLCANEDCRQPRTSVVHAFIGAHPDHARHAFVEPAPQPPADATAKCARKDCGRERHEVPAHGYGPGAHDFIPPAGPPVTGDGDEALDAAELAWSTLGSLQCDEVWEALKQAARDGLKAGLARGRALGARDENEACEKLMRERADEAAIDDQQRIRKTLHGAAVAIARRAGRGT